MLVGFLRWLRQVSFSTDFDFIDFPALLYDKTRDLSLGLCLQSVLTSMSDVSILLRIYVWRVWMKRLQYLGTAERQGRIAGTLVK